MSRKSKSRFRLPVPRLEVLSMWFEENIGDLDSRIDYLFNHRVPKANKSAACKIPIDSKIPTDRKSRKEYYLDIKRRKEYLAADKLDKEYLAADKRFRVKTEKDPANFKGRIFIRDQYCLHEIYNSKINEEWENSLYTDLPKKKRGLPGTTEEEVLEDSDGLESNSKRNEGDSVVSGHTDLSLRSPYEVKKTFLPVMGPNAGIFLSQNFLVIVHRDSGDATIDESYLATAFSWYLKHHSPFRFDDWLFWNNGRGRCEDERFKLKVDGLFHSLVLDCIDFRDSKSVRVDVKWVMMDEKHLTDTDIYIFGELSVTSVDRKSLLFKTPPNKAIKVSLGQPIPLLKSIFAVPYYADFTFSANLGCPNNVDDSALHFPIVNDSVPFPDCEIDEDEVYPGFNTLNGSTSIPCNFYELKKIIPCTGSYRSYLEVTATIDIQ